MVRGRPLDAEGPKPAPTRGPLVAIGGAEDKVGDRKVLSRVVELAGGPGAVIAVLPVASMIPGQLAATYESIFESFGATVRIVRVRTRADADSPEVLATLDGASAAFFTGGAQGRIVTLLGGTKLAQKIRRAHRAGLVVAGTSAGASALCNHMIAQGRAGYAPHRQSVTMAPGLGLTKRLVVDQHFGQRHRIGRLFAAVALNPYLMGVGIDEDTAMILDAKNRVEIIGNGTVTIVDGGRILHTDIHEVADDRPAALLGLSVHVLTSGHGFDVETRVPTWPEGPEWIAAPRPSPEPHH